MALEFEVHIHILAASGPAVRPEGRPVNHAHLVTPTGEIGSQDKQIMTRFERETWDLAWGGPLTLFDTALGKSAP